MSSRLDDEINDVIAALQAAKFNLKYYGSTGPGVERVAEIARMLAAGDSKMGEFGGLRATVADAISKAYLGRPLQAE